MSGSRPAFSDTPFAGNPFTNPLYDQEERCKRDKCTQDLLDRLQVIHNTVVSSYQKVVDSLVKSQTKLDETVNTIAQKVVSPLIDRQLVIETKHSDCCCKVMDFLARKLMPINAKTMEAEDTFGKPIEEPTEEATPSEEETETPHGEVAPFGAERPKKPMDEEDAEELRQLAQDAEFLGLEKPPNEAIEENPNKLPPEQMAIAALEAGFNRPPGQPIVPPKKKEDCCPINIQIRINQQFVNEYRTYLINTWNADKNIPKDKPLVDHITEILLATVPDIMPQPLLIESEAIAEYGTEQMLIEEESH